MPSPEIAHPNTHTPVNHRRFAAVRRDEPRILAVVSAPGHSGAPTIGATMTGLTLDHRMLAALAREVEQADPIAWGGVALDRTTVYDLIASQIVAMPARIRRSISSSVAFSVERMSMVKTVLPAMMLREFG